MLTSLEVLDNPRDGLLSCGTHGALMAGRVIRRQRERDESGPVPAWENQREGGGVGEKKKTGQYWRTGN